MKRHNALLIFPKDRSPPQNGEAVFNKELISLFYNLFMLSKNKIYCTDNVEGCKNLDGESIDLVITSPPYGKLRKYNGYIFDFENLANQLYRATKMGGIVVWITSDQTIKGSETGDSFRQALFFKEVGFKLHDTMIWLKTKMPENHNRYEQGFEYMFIFSKGSPKTFNGIRDKKNSVAGSVAHASYRDVDGSMKRTSSYKKTLIADWGLRTNTWKINTASQDKERYGHPAPFSEKLAHDHIVSWSNAGDVVLDPFVGSGTTCKVAKTLGRSYIGFDVSEKYCEIARKRIEED